jgi:hypothetical protein
MAKKTFRPVGSDKPRYPRPDDLKGRSLRKLGLVAVGSLLLGTVTTIPEAHAEETKADEPATNMRLAGKIRPPRQPSEDKAAAEPKVDAATKGSKPKKSKAAPSEKRAKPVPEPKLVTRGVMRPPRPPEPVLTPKQQPPTPKPVPQSDAGVAPDPTKK